MPTDAPVNIGAPGGPVVRPFVRVSGMQVKLHRWAVADPGRRFDDLFNFVHDPATLMVAFDRVAGNQGSRTAGVDGLTVADVESAPGVPGFLDALRADLKSGSFRPLPVRERKIPKPGGAGKVRSLGIPSVADRTVKAALKLALEPSWKQTAVHRTPDGYAVEVTADGLQRDVCLLVDKLDPGATVDDGMVTVLPGERHTFTVHTSADLDPAELVSPRLACSTVAPTITIIRPPAAHEISDGRMRVTPGSVRPIAASTSATPRNSWNHRGITAAICWAISAGGNRNRTPCAKNASASSP